MVRRTKEKVISSYVMPIIFVLSLFPPFAWEDIGVSLTSPMVNRFVYSFFHASVWHCLANLFCYYQILHYYLPSWRIILLSYIVAVSVPDFVLTELPTVGMSAMIYALIGCITFYVQRKVYYISWVLFYILIGFFFPNVNALAHLYAYCVGSLYSLLTAPLCRMK